MSQSSNYKAIKEMFKADKNTYTASEVAKIFDKVSVLSENMKVVLSQIPYAVVWFDEGAKIKYINNKFAEMFEHWFKGNIEGRNISDIQFSASRKHVMENFRRAMGGEIIRERKFSVLRTNGGNTWYEYSYYRLEQDNECAGCLVVVKDISESIAYNQLSNDLVDVRDVYSDFFNYQDSVLFVLSATDEFKPIYISSSCKKDLDVSFLIKRGEKASKWSELVYEKDVKRFETEMFKMLKYGSRFDILYYRIIDDSGVIRWVKQTCLPKFYDNGDIKYITCAIKDVSLKSSILEEMYDDNYKMRMTYSLEGEKTFKISERYLNYDYIRKIIDDKDFSSIVNDLKDVAEIACIDFDRFSIKNNNIEVSDFSELKRMNIDTDRFAKNIRGLYLKFLQNRENAVKYTNSDGKEVRIIPFGIGTLLIAVFIIKPLDNVYSNMEAVHKSIKMILRMMLRIMRKNLVSISQIDEYKDSQERLLATIASQKRIPLLINTFYASHNYYVGFQRVLEMTAKLLNIDRIQVLSYNAKQSTVSNYFSYYKRDTYKTEDERLADVFGEEFLSLFTDQDMVFVSNYANVSKVLKSYSFATGANSSVFYTSKVDDEIRHIIIFDDMLYQREWTTEMLLLIENVCAVLGTLVINEHATSSMFQTQNTFVKVLDELQSYIIIIDIDTRQTLFQNRMLTDMASNFDINEYCKAFGSENCDDCKWGICPLHKFGSLTDKGYSYEHFDEEQNNWYMVTLNKITWQGTKNAIMLNAVDITVTKEIKNKDDKFLNTDSVTDLYNSVKYKSCANEFLKLNETAGNKVAQIVLEVQDFKGFFEENDYESANGILKNIADVLTAVTEGSNSVIARVSEESFIVLYPYSDGGKLASMLRKMFSHLDKLVYSTDSTKKIKVAGGIACFPEHGNSDDVLYEKSKLALMMTKRQENLNYKIYDMMVQSTVESDEKFRKEILQAYKSREFVLYFQPKLNLKTAKIDSAEALIRWEHPTRGLLSAYQFVDVLDYIDSKSELGYYIMEEVIKSVKAFNLTEKGKNFKISFNVLAKTFQKFDFFQKLTELVRYYKINPHNLEIELTEKMLVKSTKYSVNLIEQFKKLGVRISIDDFGTGYSSLSYLKLFDVNAIKIDKMFLEGIFTDKRAKGIAIGIINLAKMLNFEVLFEGVETQEELAFVRENGCDHIQGYYVGKAMPMSELYKLL